MLVIKNRMYLFCNASYTVLDIASKLDQPLTGDSVNTGFIVLDLLLDCEILCLMMLMLRSQ